MDRVDRREVPSSAIDELDAAVREPATPEPSLQSLGITGPWLQANGEPTVRGRYKDYFDSAAPNQRVLFLRSFSNQTLMEKLVRDLYRSRWTDDYAFLEVTIANGSGRRTLVKSTA